MLTTTLTIRRLSGLLLAVLLTATALSMPSGASAAPLDAPVALAKKAKDPRYDFPRMPRKCVDPKLKIPQTPTKCNLNGFQKGRPTIVLWGDSHAWQMIPALRKAARDRDVNLVAFVMGSCPAMDPALTAKERHGGAPACLISNDRALRYVAGLKAQKKRVHVLLGTYWQRYLHAIKVGDSTSYHGKMAAYWKTAGPRLFRTLGRLKVGVDVDGQMVTVPANVKDCYTDQYFAYSCDLPRKKALRGEKSTKNWVKRQMRQLSGKPRYVNPNQMCTAKKCFAKVGKTNTYWDNQHISASMSGKLSYVLDQTVTRAGGTGEPHGGGPLLDGNQGGGGGGGGGGDGCFLIFCR